MAIGSDVSDAPTASTPTYCTAADVARILQQPAPSAAADEGEPTLADWNQSILEAEEEIDRTTGTSWRPRRVLLEYHDWTTWLDAQGWKLVQLRHAPVKTLSAASSDALEVRAGGQWEDWLASKTAGPAGEYWLQEDTGYLRIRRGFFEGSPNAALRISYRYGSSTVPADIKRAAALMVAAELNSGATVAVGGFGGEAMRVQLEPRVNMWRRSAAQILARHQRVGRGY